MSRLDRFDAEERGAPAGVVQGSIGFGAGGPVWLDEFRSKRPPNPFELVNAYKAVAYACIQLNANGVARVPLHLYARTSPRQRPPGRGWRTISKPVNVRRERYLRSLPPQLFRTLGPDDRVDEITEHPFLELFRAPNPYFDGNLLLQMITRSLDAVGSFYLYPERPVGSDGLADVGFAAEKGWPLQAQYVYAVKGNGEAVRFNDATVTTDEVLKEYRYFGDTYTPEKLVRLRYLSLRDPYLSAYAPLHACFEQVGLGNYYTAVVESILKSGARPSGMLSPKDSNQPWGEDVRKRLEIDANNKYAGGRSGHILVANGAYEWTPFQFPPSDLGGLEITKWVRLITANVFDVPISLLQAEDSNRAVASEGTHQHQQLAVEPRCWLIASGLTQQLAQPVDPRLFFAFDDPVQRDKERDAKVWDMKIKNGTATPNEARADEGEEPVEWGDEPWMPNNLIQPSAAAEEREAKADLRDQMAKAKVEGAGAKKPTPDPGEVPGQPPEPKVDETERALVGQLARVLTHLEWRLEDDRLGRGDGGDRGELPEGGAGSGSGGRGEHVRPAGGAADLGRAEGLVPEAEGGGGGGDPGRGDAAPAQPADDGGAHRGDGPVDGPDPGDVLGRGGEGDVQPPGPGPGGVEGHEPAPAAQDRDGGAQLLPVDQPDDGQAPGRSAGEPAEEPGGGAG